MIVSPLLPPQPGGLADHTLGLARHLSTQFRVGILSSRDVYDDGPVPIRATVHHWDDPTELTNELLATPRDTLLLWQYVPHMYGRGGVNRYLPALWKGLKAQGRRQVVLAHEIAAPWGYRPDYWWYGWNHRRQWNAALRHADLLPISTEAWLEEWRRRRPDAASRMFLMPSPSAIDPIQVVPGHGETWRRSQGLPPGIPIVLWWGSVAANKQLEWVISAWEMACRKLGPTGLCLVGATPQVSLAGSLREYARILGYVKPEEVSSALHACDVLALPYVDGASERRTTLMAGLAHGIAVVSTRGHNTGPTLSGADWLVGGPTDDKARFVEGVLSLLNDASRRRAVGAGGKAWHDAHYSWPVVTRTLVGQMDAAGITEW